MQSEFGVQQNSCRDKTATVIRKSQFQRKKIESFKLGEWTEWSECLSDTNCGGIRTRNRICTTSENEVLVWSGGVDGNWVDNQNNGIVILDVN